MRVLVLTRSESPLVRAMARLGHDVVAIPPGLRTLVPAVLRHRPDVAYLALEPGALRVALSLLALRIPYGVELDRDVLPAAPALGVIRAARTVIAPSETLARHAVDALGARDAAIVPPAIDLATFVPGDRDAARERLHLQPGLRFVTLVAALDPSLRLDVLAEAHRRLSGTGLLVVGDGPGAPFVQAMRAATRPSSPVVFLGAGPREEQVLAIQAAHACVSLTGGDSEYAACGRRQAALPGPSAERLESLYAPELVAVQVVAASPVALRQALASAVEAEMAAALPEAAIARARDALGWEHVARQVAQVLEDAL